MIEEKTMSENSEAVVVLAESICATVFGYVLAIPLPPEIEVMRIPTLTMVGGIATSIFTYWKTKINKPVKVEA